MKTVKPRTLKSLDDTKKFAAEFAKDLKPGMCIGLCGPLGSGKTTFVRLLAEVLGVTGEVSSPTYVLQNRYEAPKFLVEHWDLYRVSALPPELTIPSPDDALMLIEWSDRFPELNSALDLTIQFKINTDSDQVHVREVYLT